MPDPVAMTAAPEDAPRLISSLVTAFAADPFIRWMFPDAEQYLRSFPLVLTHFAGGAFDHGSACRTADYRAAALWLPPGVAPDEAALGAVMEEGVAPDLQAEVFGVLEEVGAGHPDEAHWYLPAMGADPTCQRKGYGSAVMAESLRRCDEGHIAAYLESTNPANIPFYQRFGFDVVGDIQSGSSPVVTRMLRAAR